MLRNERSTHEINPKDHIRNVQTGRVGSSSLETVSRTSSIGETSSSSSSGLLLVAESISMAAAIVAWSRRKREREREWKVESESVFCLVTLKEMGNLLRFVGLGADTGGFSVGGRVGCFYSLCYIFIYLNATFLFSRSVLIASNERRSTFLY